ncbi:2OG-Fe(II) oxygenase superfamily-domain containing protein [Nitzschia inconspicua]|uniref:2OG-Fe(II) oxygenase superfamily-domain containing protein n=1 Tax=Nitzschia inconspicua TaxID=303405 RepID=A0A9K3KBW4_9STRA|nr:2OG-Fe(II) oxygenase superfamily-domain containing protein [Nitzschia inconspicua]
MLSSSSTVLMDRVPIIDLQDPNESNIVAQLDAALQQFGFFNVKNHGIPESLIEQQFDISKQLFDLPLHIKQSMPFDGTLDIGYLAAGGQALEKTLRTAATEPQQQQQQQQSTEKQEGEGQIDTKEQFMMTNNKLITASADADHSVLTVDPDNVFDGSQNYNLRPYIPDHPRVTSDYMSAAYKLNLRLQHYLFEALQLDSERRRVLGQHPFLVLKQMKYAGPPSDPSKGQYGAGPHTDWGSFTILATDQQPGLQLLWNGGDVDQWLDVPPIPNTLIINAGDQIATLTNHYYKSALHRVVTTSRTVRYSTAVFTYFGLSATFAPLPQFCGGDQTTDLVQEEGRTTREYFHYKLHQSVYGSDATGGSTDEEKKE